MKYMEFMLKTMSLVLILLILGVYQQIAVERATQVEAHEAQVAEVEAYNQEVLKAMNQAEESGASYQDGTYSGEAMGFGGNIKVEVTVADGKLASIDVKDASGEDPAYYDQAIAVVDKMLKDQSTEVDTVSGATFSSKGLIGAVEQALEGAVSK